MTSEAKIWNKLSVHKYKHITLKCVKHKSETKHQNLSSDFSRIDIFNWNNT